MIARKADVSRGTVDRVLNQRPHVKPELYERVVRAMKELGYVPPREEQAEALGLPSATLKPCTLGVLLRNEEGYFKSEVLRGIADAREALQEYQVDILVEECETDMPDETVERLEHLVQQGAKGVALCTLDHSRIVEKVNAMCDMGIAVVTFNTDLSNSKRMCFVGQDLIRSGRIAGELMSKCIHLNDTMLIAIGNPEFNAHRLRLQGFCERIYERGYSGGNVEIIETYNDYSLTYERVKEVLGRVSDVKGIYMANHSVTGCVQAVRDMGMQGKVHIISHDLTEATKRLLKNGEIDFSIAQNIYWQGYRPMILLREYVQKNIVPKTGNSSTSIEIMCSENLDL
ncbi:MAG: LacI family DNA-binding transcriptional regulator [Butyricicoccus sp.]